LVDPECNTPPTTLHESKETEAGDELAEATSCLHVDVLTSPLLQAARSSRTFSEDMPETNISFPRYRDLIGDTPLVDITSLCNPKAKNVRVLGKAEFLNPGFSMKDRIVKSMLDGAEARGELVPGKDCTVVAASSGNTGASVAMQCAMRGYDAVILTNQKCSQEKCDAIRAYGADLRIVEQGVCYMQEETRLASLNPTWFSLNQYDNPDNPKAHYGSTGPEIWRDTGGRVTHFVAAGSTGGTVSGTGRYLKEQNPAVKVVMSDPVGSIFFNYHKTGQLDAPGKFLVEGVGKNNIPGAMDFGVVDDMIQVSDKDAFKMCKTLARTEGICCGGSTGLNVCAAIQLANETEQDNAVIVTILCDLGVKYLSKVYNDQWLESNKMM
jgi:cysteine synthase